MTESIKESQGKYELLQVLLGILITGAITLVGHWVTSAIKEREIHAKYVELGVLILQGKPTEETKNLRQWAVEVLNQYSGIPINEATQQDLIKNVPLPETNLVTVAQNARVFLLAGTNSKTKMFPDFQFQLVRAGFNVLGAKQIEDPDRPNEPEVRYFNPSDKQQADIVVKFVRSRLSNQAIPAKYYKDVSAKPGYVEIWFGR